MRPTSSSCRFRLSTNFGVVTVAAAVPRRVGSPEHRSQLEAGAIAHLLANVLNEVTAQTIEAAVA